MPKVIVELDWDTVDNIIVQQVTDARDGLIEQLEERKGDGNKGGANDFRTFHISRSSGWWQRICTSMQND